MKKEIIQFIATDLNNDKELLNLASDEDLLGAGLVESMGMMRLFQFIEETFKVTVEPEDMTIDNFITVDAMVNFIHSSK